MLDYTDISGRVEDVKNALNSLYELVYSQYDGIFQGEDAEKYRRMIQSIEGANRCMNEVNDINDRLSDAFEDKLRDAYMNLKEKVINSKTNHEDIEAQATDFFAEARACAERERSQTMDSNVEDVIVKIRRDKDFFYIQYAGGQWEKIKISDLPWSVAALINTYFDKRFALTIDAEDDE